jgi:hypothetical protein
MKKYDCEAYAYFIVMCIITINSEVSDFVLFSCQLISKQGVHGFTAATTNYYGFVCEYVVKYHSIVDLMTHVQYVCYIKM